MIFIDMRFCGFDDCEWDGEVEVDRDMSDHTDLWFCPICGTQHIEFMDEGWWDRG